ncbi:MAG TPA: arginine deiminase family protein [Gemmataceae bacterium]|nr:arginine deiminase family protein [Gemmataceae bacterium]
MLALTQVPSPSIDFGQRSHVARTLIDWDLLLQQHASYCQSLRDCDLEVRVLDVNRACPDGTFLEDTAIVLDEVAVLTSMGTEARRAELPGIERELRQYRQVQRIALPATIEGGDVLRVGRTLLVGVSARTNPAGVQAFEAIVRPHGYVVVPVTVRGCLHLKTACTALPDGSLLLNPSWLDLHSLAGFEQVPVPRAEPWGANTLPIGATVCIPGQHVQTAEMIRQRGFHVRPIDVSEFAKAEGSVTCLSLLIRTT